MIILNVVYFQYYHATTQQQTIVYSIMLYHWDPEVDDLLYQV